MEFILDSLAQLTVNTGHLLEAQERDRAAQERDRAAQERDRAAQERDRARTARLEESFLVLIELASRHEERLDAGDRRAANLETAIAELRRMLDKDA
jgi:hypothetical protein